MNYIVKNENALYYECGYSCDNAIFLSLSSEKFFITDARYTNEAKLLVKNVEVVDGARNLIDTLVAILKKENIKELTIDPQEWNILEYNKLTSLDTNFIQESNFSQKKRMIKTNQEISIIKEAATIGEFAFYKFSQYLQSEGLDKSEEFLNYHFSNILKDMGKYDLSFDPIIAIDENSAKPHALPTKKSLSENSLLLVDAGIKYKRYCSDRTRTSQFHHSIDFLTTQNFTDMGRQRIYDTVLKAHDKAVEAVKVGVKASQIDKAARDVFEKAGLLKEFLHSTGHGVGLDIHELPNIAPTSDIIIEENMVFTIEPGLYFDKGFGVRIEDMVIVQDGKAQII